MSKVGDVKELWEFEPSGDLTPKVTLGERPEPASDHVWAVLAAELSRPVTLTWNLGTIRKGKWKRVE